MNIRCSRSVPKHLIDTEALYFALNDERQQQGLSWRQVAKQSGVSTLQLTRLQSDKQPSDRVFRALLQWLRTEESLFMREPERIVKP